MVNNSQLDDTTTAELEQMLSNSEEVADDPQIDQVTDTSPETTKLIADLLGPSPTEAEKSPEEDLDTKETVEKDLDTEEVPEEASDTEEVPEEVSEQEADTQEAPEEVTKEDPNTEEEPKEEVEASDFGTMQEFLNQEYKVKGRVSTVKSPEEARNLISKGLGFEQNQKRLKTFLPIMQALSSAGVTDPADIARLIDIQNGDPEAIQNLIDNKKVILPDLEYGDTPTEYTPKTIVPDATVAGIKEGLEGFQESSKNLVISTLTTTFEDSLDVFGNDPELLNGLAEHLDNGMFATVQDYVASTERSNGFEANLTSLQKYDIIFTKLQQEGKFGTPKGTTKTPKKASNNVPTGSEVQKKEASNLAAKLTSPRGVQQAPSTRQTRNLDDLTNQELDRLLEAM